MYTLFGLVHLQERNMPEFGHEIFLIEQTGIFFKAYFLH